jgi:hypothetical protein
VTGVRGTAGDGPALLAEALRAARPDAEPGDLMPAELDALVREVGGDADDADLVGRALVEWERMLA